VEITPISLAKSEKEKFLAVRAVGAAFEVFGKIEDENSDEAWDAQMALRDSLADLCIAVQVDPTKLSFADVTDLISILQTGDVAQPDPPSAPKESG